MSKKLFHIIIGLAFFGLSIVFIFIKFYNFLWMNEIPSDNNVLFSTVMRDHVYYYLVMQQNHMNIIISAIATIIGLSHIFYAFNKTDKAR
ncbi:MAG TPA: hypothetical protein PKU69_00010 [Bacillota bacterium]|nr:hypothetical protein [Bacillota bacterium]